eukprot:1495740-Pleurochrysis_carterae.AAC.2
MVRHYAQCAVSRLPVHTAKGRDLPGQTGRATALEWHVTFTMRHTLMNALHGQNQSYIESKLHRIMVMLSESTLL